MHATPAEDPREFRGEEIVGAARISEGADVGRNDRQLRTIWAAGFFDGEGSIGIYRARREQIYQLSIAVNQVLVTPLEILVDLFGGSVYGREKHLKSWRLGSRLAASALEAMIPFLINKKQEALLAVHFQRDIKRDQRGARPGKFGPTILSAQELEMQRQASEQLKQLKRLS